MTTARGNLAMMAAMAGALSVPVPQAAKSTSPSPRPTNPQPTTAGTEYLNGSHRAINPKRRAKKATGLKGRQWVKHRKAEQRAKRLTAA
jgi:hypothetical protein